MSARSKITPDGAAWAIAQLTAGCPIQRVATTLGVTGPAIRVRFREAIATGTLLRRGPGHPSLPLNPCVICSKPAKHVLCGAKACASEHARRTAAKRWGSTATEKTRLVGLQLDDTSVAVFRRLGRGNLSEGARRLAAAGNVLDGTDRTTSGAIGMP